MKKLLKKAVSITAALSLAAAYSVSAALKTGGGTSASDPYYWQENFNDYTEGSYSYSAGGTKPDCVTIPNNHKQVYVQSKKVSENDYALEIKGDKVTATSGEQVKIVTGKCNFENGPVIVQFDATFAAAPQGFRMDLCDNEKPTLIGNIIQAKSNKWWGYPGATWNSASTKTIATKTKYRFAAYLDYNKTKDTITVIPYVDGERLVRNDGNNTPIEYDITGKKDVLGNTLVLRFYAYKNDDVIIDNVTVRNASTVNLANIGYINSSDAAGVGYTDTPAYKDSDGNTVLLAGAVKNKIAAASSSSQITLKKYNYADDPLLLNPTEQAAKVSYSLENNFGMADLTLTDAKKELYVAKLNDASDFASITGQATKNQYVLLMSSSLGAAPVVRETKLIGADGEALALTDGKLPQSTERIETTVSYYSAVPEMKIEGEGVSKTATANGNVLSIDLSEMPLLPGEDYTITVGNVSKTYTATGEKAKMSAAIETFGDAAAVTKETNSGGTNIALDRSGNKLLYKNSAKTGTKDLDYNFKRAFNFDGGKNKMLVSFKVELNQDIKWNSESTNSHLLLPNVLIGGKTVYMPAIEHTGFRARTSSGGRNTDKPSEYTINTMTKNKTYYCSVLVEYDAENSKLKYTQYVNGIPMNLKPTNGDAYDVGAFEISDVTENDLNSDIDIKFMGRNFNDGGLYIDDLAITTLGTEFSVSQPVIAEDNAVTVNAVNKTENIYKMYIILASYKDDELLDIEYGSTRINFTDTQYSFTPSGDFNTEGATAVKAFVWDGLAGAVPYAANGEK